MATIGLLTCTGGRPEAFALCERWIAAQTVPPDRWVVVDDVETPTACTMGQTVIRPEPYWQPDGPCTLGRNMLVGLDHIDADVVVIIEDDDHYDPSWLETCAACGPSELMGEGWTTYYNVQTRRWHTHGNTSHASMCATAFGYELLDDVCGIVSRMGDDPFIDCQMWHELRAHGRIMSSSHVLGIKGLSGRAGAGNGHTRSLEWSNADIPGTFLRELIGDDADAYLKFHH